MLSIAPHYTGFPTLSTLPTVIQSSFSFFYPSVAPGQHHRFLGVLHPLGGRLPAPLLHHTAAQLSGGPWTQEAHRPNQTEPGWVSQRAEGGNVTVGRDLEVRDVSWWSLDGTRRFQGFRANSLCWMRLNKSSIRYPEDLQTSFNCSHF